MGPRAFAHGDHGSERARPAKQGSFNGAAGFRPRRLPSLLPCPVPRAPLQWGRGLSPTETGSDPVIAATLGVLQWGRGLSPTETSQNPKRPFYLRQASMGPRAFAHGDAVKVSSGKE